MRRMLLPLIFIILLVIPYSGNNNAPVHTDSETSGNGDMDMKSLASAGGSGSDKNSVLYMSRDLEGIQTSVLNTYVTTTSHNGTLDLTQYLVSGWTLYRADLDIENITAAPEREAIGIPATLPADQLLFAITEYGSGDTYYAMLAQGFYNQAHTGMLINYSVPYFTNNYNTASRGTSYLVIVSDYTDNSTGLTTPAAMVDHGSGWDYQTVDGESLILSSSTTYYVYMNGSELHEDIVSSTYPDVYWRDQDSAGSFNSARWSTEFMAWSSGLSYEGLTNYTYVPWSTIDGAPAVYSGPTDVSLTGNSSALAGSSWNFNAVAGNLTSIDFNSNQSVYINHNLTLWYEKTVTTINTWDVQNSGDIIDWNATTGLAYPSVSGTLSRYANISVGGDWSISGLYNSSTPHLDYGNYVDYGTYIHCSNMNDETWTLTFSGHNHVTSLASNVAAVNSSVISILSNVNIDASIEQFDATAVTTGNANLTIWHYGSTIQPPQVDLVSDGTFSYAWEINSTTSNNGTYSILVYWTNGTEAGYREIPVVVYFPTMLAAASTYVEGYADSTIDISVFFNETFTPKALDANFATVVYFNGTSNSTMTDHANGTWTTAVDTTGWALGSYPIIVYAEGFAIENQTEYITIAVVEPSSKLDGMHVWWVVDNNISYIETAQLRVNYSTSAGGVVGATVNVTDGTITWDLNWDGGTETYWIDLTGSDFSLGPGTYPLTVSAWANGVETQVNDTLEIVIVEEETNLAFGWLSYSFDYSRSVNFSVVYSDHLGTPIVGASQVDIAINGMPYFLDDAGNGTYWIELDRFYDLGNHTVVVTLSKLGYQTAINSSIWFNITIAKANVDIDPVSPMQVYFTHSDPLTITLTDDEGDPIDSAVVWLEYDGTNYTLVEGSVGVFQILINGSDGLGLYPIRVFTFTYGFFNESLSGMQIEIIETPTSLDASGTRIVGMYTTLYNDGSITFNVLYEDIDGFPLTTGLVNITINGTTYDLTPGTSNFTLTLEARFIGIDSFSAEIKADLDGYEGATIFYPVVVEPVPTYIETDTAIPSVMYLNQTVTIRVRYWNNNSGSWLLPGEVHFDWSSSLSPSGPDVSGWYQITLSSDSLDIQQHNLNITFGLTNYTTASIIMPITVRVVNTDFYVIGTYSTYENETVRLRVFYHDLDHDAPISWGTVIATLEGTDYAMTYDGASVYIADIRADLEWGSYQFSLSALATGCATGTTTTSLTLYEKDHVYVELIHPVVGDLTVEGESTTIAAQVKYNNSVQTELAPLASASVHFLVTIRFSNGTSFTWPHTDTTDEEGVASWSFPVPTSEQAEISNMTVDAWYLGSNTRWSALASTLKVEVGFDFLQQLIRFISSDLGIMMILSLVVIGTVAVGYNKKFKPKKREARRGLMRQLDSFKELEMMQHFMAVYIDRGTCVFYHPFRDSRIQPDLISGFIAAITSVYGEIKGDGVQGSLEEINYQGLRLNSYSGKFIIGIVIVEGDMSARLRDRLQFFVELFEDQYYADLDGWTGLVDCFDPEWVVSNLNAAFNYTWMLPHTIVRKVRVKGQEAKVLKYIHTKFGEGEFLLLGIIEEIAQLLGCTDAEAFDILLRLEDNGGIKPIGIHSVLQRQGLGIAEEDDGSLYETDTHVEPPKPEVKKAPPTKEKPEPKPEPTTEPPPKPKPEIVETPKPKPAPKPPPKPKPEVVETPKLKPKPIIEEKAKELSEEDKFLADVVALMEEEDKEKKDKKKKD